MDLTREVAVRRLDDWDRLVLPDAGLRRAAVALTVVPDPGPDDDGRGIWLARRPATMRRHANQFALPGGRLDPGETIEEAALRELHEEFGIELSSHHVLGVLDDYQTRSGFLITPVVCWLDDLVEPVPDPSEVAQVFLVPLAETAAEPSFDRIPESERPLIRMPMIGRWIHAPTAALIHQFGQVVVRGEGVRVNDLEEPTFAWR